MNKSGVPTAKKVLLPLRLTPQTYNALVKRVREEKDKNRGFSINQFISEVLEKELKVK